MFHLSWRQRLALRSSTMTGLFVNGFVELFMYNALTQGCFVSTFDAVNLVLAQIIRQCPV
jgi:hypothetical protein